MRRIQGEGTSRPTEHIHNRETHPKALSNTDALWQTQHDIYQVSNCLHPKEGGS